MTEAYQTISVMIFGAADSGKKTFIRAVRDTIPMTGEYQGKHPAHVTVAQDFGRMVVPGQPIVIYLFAIRSNLPWPPMEDTFSDETRRYAGYIVTVNSAPNRDWDEREQRETLAVINTIRERGLPFVIAATKQDKPHARSAVQIRDLLQLPDDIKIIPCGAKTDPDSARRALLELFALLPQDNVIQHAQSAIRDMINK
ncbi:MAG: hypothetical protein ABI690_23770 [Chloroflexota bacterium]